MNHHKKIILILILVLLVGIYFVSKQSKVIQKNLSEKIGNNIEHGVTCTELPQFTLVEQVVHDHVADVENVLKAISANDGETNDVTVEWDWNNHWAIGKIHNTNASYGGFTWGPPVDCLNKNIATNAEVRFVYSSDSDRQLIINKFGKTFFGVPYSGNNN